METEDQRFRALTKLERKSCDLMVLNGPAAMDALDNQVEVIDRAGQIVRAIAGPKEMVAEAIVRAARAATGLPGLPSATDLASKLDDPRSPGF